MPLQKQVGCFNHRVHGYSGCMTNWSQSSVHVLWLQDELGINSGVATTIHALNSLITAVLPSPDYNFLTATLKCICNDSFIDDPRIVSILWL